MTKLNHGRPALRTTDAGGGERIRTIAEELAASQRARSDSEPRRCRSCGNRGHVMDGACRACLADERVIKSANRKLHPRKNGKGNSQGRLAYVDEPQGKIDRRALQRQIDEARARIAARKRRVSHAPRPQAGPRPGGRVVGTADLKKAERAVEDARKDLLMARSDWEKDILRGRYRKAQEELSLLQRQVNARRSLG
ncbi:hypothetical protein [Geodermatophilus nigrescens]|uniref:Uncharacterized protein n=1 Tax=Geodermatophilus nigrescens TaxID=1070870 RepID=A0A1M5JPX7_9ACTN|nr:hypothetical protein [Geodermatophilus nigrescens]SHG42329.1 hypothetical protein SAMN05444351_2591 [Geodermatophilus nigrescens]